MKALRPCLLASIAFLIAGCARLSTTTTIRPDGSFTRKNVYTVTANNSPMAQAADNQPKKDKPEDFFKVPAKGAGVDVTSTKDSEKATATVIREVPAGSAALHDISLLSDKGKVMATSAVTVTKRTDGTIEYVETLHR